MRARLLLIGALVLASFGVTAGAYAGGDEPTLALDRTGTAEGEEMVVTGTGWPAGDEVIVELCGRGGREGSASCDVTNSRTAGVDDAGALRTPLVVGRPPLACPCVVRGTSRSSEARAIVEVAVQGMPTVPLPDEAPLTPARFDVTVTASGNGPWQSWFGAPARRTVVIEVTNSGGQPVARPSVSVVTGRSADPDRLVATRTLDSLAPGETTTETVPVELESFSFGSYAIVATVDGVAVAAVAADTSVVTYPWALIALGVLAIQLLLLRLRDRLRARVARQAAAGDEHTAEAPMELPAADETAVLALGAGASEWAVSHDRDRDDEMVDASVGIDGVPAAAEVAPGVVDVVAVHDAVLDDEPDDDTEVVAEIDEDVDEDIDDEIDDGEIEVADETDDETALAGEGTGRDSLIVLADHTTDRPSPALHPEPVLDGFLVARLRSDVAAMERTHRSEVEALIVRTRASVAGDAATARASLDEEVARAKAQLAASIADATAGIDSLACEATELRDTTEREHERSLAAHAEVQQSLDAARERVQEMLEAAQAAADEVRTSAVREAAEAISLAVRTRAELHELLVESTAALEGVAEERRARVDELAAAAADRLDDRVAFFLDASVGHRRVAGEQLESMVAEVARRVTGDVMEAVFTEPSLLETNGRMTSVD